MTFPNGVFSGTIISSVIKDGDIKQTAEWQLLLGAIALPGEYGSPATLDVNSQRAGVFVGALLCNNLGRRNTVRVVLTFPAHPRSEFVF